MPRPSLEKDEQFLTIHSVQVLFPFCRDSVRQEHTHIAIHTADTYLQFQ